MADVIKLYPNRALRPTLVLATHNDKLMQLWEEPYTEVTEWREILSVSEVQDILNPLDYRIPGVE